MTILLPLLGTFSSGLTDAINFGQDEGLTKLELPVIIEAVANGFIFIATIYALVAFAWAGLNYVISLGNENRAASAKRTIFYGALGLIIAGSTYLIRDIFKQIYLTGDIAPAQRDQFVNIVLSIVQLFLLPAGIIAFGVVVYGGYMYITSAGDESRASAGKKAIIYAILGLIVIGLAGIITNAVINLT